MEFHNYKDSVMRAARILRVPTMYLKDILHKAEGDHLDESTQIGGDSVGGMYWLIE